MYSQDFQNLISTSDKILSLLEGSSFHSDDFLVWEVACEIFFLIRSHNVHVFLYFLLEICFSLCSPQQKTLSNQQIQNFSDCSPPEKNIFSPQLPKPKNH